MSSQKQQPPVEDLLSRLNAQKTRLDKLQSELERVVNGLKVAEEQRDELQRRLADVEDDTDLLRLNEAADTISADQRRSAILQHMWRAIRHEPDEERVYAMDVDKVKEILHYPDVDRTTINRWMRTTPRLVGNKDVCWYDGGDAGPGGRPARIHLDLRSAGETLLENVRRQSNKSS